MDCLGEMLN